MQHISSPQLSEDNDSDDGNAGPVLNYLKIEIVSKTAKMASVHLCWLLVLFLVLRYEENSIEGLQKDSSIFHGKEPCQQFFSLFVNVASFSPVQLKVKDKENRDIFKTLTSWEFEGTQL